MKIHIIGGPGSGKSFLAEQLSKEFGIQHYDLDKYQRDNLVEIKELLIPYSYKLINIEGEDTQ
jgi:adenylate kinase family enzyme